MCLYLASNRIVGIRVSFTGLLSSGTSKRSPMRKPRWGSSCNTNSSLPSGEQSAAMHSVTRLTKPRSGLSLGSLSRHAIIFLRTIRMQGLHTELGGAVKLRQSRAIRKLSDLIQKIVPNRDLNTRRIASTHDRDLAPDTRLTFLNSGQGRQGRRRNDDGARVGLDRTSQLAASMPQRADGGLLPTLAGERSMLLEPCTKA